jgi:hypothetical protein
MFDPSDLLIELCIKIAYRSLSLFVNMAKGIWRAVNVRRKAPEESHAPVEYVDALLFPEENFGASDSSTLRRSMIER